MGMALAGAMDGPNASRLAGLGATMAGAAAMLRAGDGRGGGHDQAQWWPGPSTSTERLHVS